MNDLISRQAAIDAFMIAISDGDKAEWCKWVLERLPSAKPEPLVKESRTLVKDLVKDTISRQVAINTDGLDEEIRCEMCRNQMKTDRGCDGNCKYDEKLYEKIMQILDKRITPLPSAQPEPHYCRECKWCRCHIYVDKYGNTETYWHCHNWDGGTDEEGYCYEWERKTDEGSD